ncbi:unnamed protein product, partial [marine sediment metagenome]
AGQDKYANVLTEKITMSAANTLTFQEVNIGLSLFDKAGILISRIEYQPTGGTIADLETTGDLIGMAVATSDNIANLGVDQAAVVTYKSLIRLDLGTAAAGWIFELPLVQDFSQLPGGGILITPKPWYIAMESGGLAAAGICTVRFFFTVVKLTAEMYFELLETRHYFG